MKFIVPLKFWVFCSLERVQKTSVDVSCFRDDCDRRSSRAGCFTKALNAYYGDHSWAVSEDITKAHLLSAFKRFGSQSNYGW